MSNQKKGRGRPRPWILSCDWFRLLRTTSMTVLDQKMGGVHVQEMLHECAKYWMWKKENCFAFTV